MLRLADVAADLAGRPVLRGVGLAVAAGEVVGLVGPNGAGKSTLMRAAAGQIAFTGTIMLGDQPVTGLDAAERARRVAFLAQGRTIAWPANVADLVDLGRLAHRPAFARPSAADRAAVAAAMALLDIARLASRRATELSGGEQARVLAARAVAQDAPLLLADEPVAGLDPAHQIGLMAALRRLAGQGKAVLVSMHDLTLAARWCDRIALMAGGRIVADGPPGEVLDAGRLGSVFGVTAHVGLIAGKPVVTPLDLVEGGR